MGCILSEPTSTTPTAASNYVVKTDQTSHSSHSSNNKQQTRTSTGSIKQKTRSSTIQLSPSPIPPASGSSRRVSSPAPLQIGDSSPLAQCPSSPTPPETSPTPTPSKHERAYEYTGEQQTHEAVLHHECPRIDLTLIPADTPAPRSQTDRVILPPLSITPTSPVLESASADTTPRIVVTPPSPTRTMLHVETRRSPHVVLSPTSATRDRDRDRDRDIPTLSRPLSLSASHDTPVLKLPHIHTASSTTLPAIVTASTSTPSPVASSTPSTPSIPILTSSSSSSSSSPSSSSLSVSTNHSPRSTTVQPLLSISTSRPSLSRPQSSNDRSARHHHLTQCPTPSHFTPHAVVPDTPSFCSPRNAHAKSFFGASASKPPGTSRPGSASSRTTISQRAVLEADSSSSSEEEEAEEEESSEEEDEEESELDPEEELDIPPPVRSKSSLSVTPEPMTPTTEANDNDDAPPVFKSVAHLRIDPAAEPCATVIKPPLRRMCRARHVVWDASPEANHAAYQPPSEILPFLYLGCYDNVYDTPVKSDAKQKEMQALGLSHILTVASECSTPYSQFQYLKISIQDDVRSHIHPHFIEAFDFIDQARDKGGKCIVHCWAGVSRSATIVIGYLIARMGMRFDLAHAHVRERRPIVHPNISFREALLNLDACVHEPERYAQQQKELVAMLGDSDNAIIHLDRNIVCGNKRFWGEFDTLYPTNKR